MCKIAILGYGSLIRSPRNLKLKGDWQYGGPALPVEFCRITHDGRLALSISPGVEHQPSFYAQSSFTNLEDAISNLAKREGCNIRHIGAAGLKTPVVNKWLYEHEFDHVLYSSLPANFKEVRGEELRGWSACRYLDTLDMDAFDRAWNYILDVPEEIHSRIRDFILRNYNTFIDENSLRY